MKRYVIILVILLGIGEKTFAAPNSSNQNYWGIRGSVVSIADSAIPSFGFSTIGCHSKGYYLVEGDMLFIPKNDNLSVNFRGDFSLGNKYHRALGHLERRYEGLNEVIQTDFSIGYSPISGVIGANIGITSNTPMHNITNEPKGSMGYFAGISSYYFLDDIPMVVYGNLNYVLFDSGSDIGIRIGSRCQLTEFLALSGDVQRLVILRENSSQNNSSPTMLVGRISIEIVLSPYLRFGKNN